MADRVRKVKYCYVTVANRAGQGDSVLAAFEKTGVSLLAVSAFPTKGGKAQIDILAESMAAIRRVGRANGSRLSGIKQGFLVQGTDTIGAVHRQVHKLAREKINIVALEAVAAGKGRYGMIFWVKPKDYGRAAKVLRAK